MLMGQTHFMQMDFEPSWRLRLFLGPKETVCFAVHQKSFLTKKLI